MIEEPEVQLSALKKGECFMYFGDPYIVKRIYWRDLGLMKRKVWLCTMKFDNKDWCYCGDSEVYRISKGLYDILVESE